MPISLGVTVDKYKGYHYFVCDITTANHKKPYVAVAKNDQRVARIYLQTRVVEFYQHTPKEVSDDRKTLETWITKERNWLDAKKAWNSLNPDYRMD